MGREAKTAKERRCWHCKEVFFVDAKGIKEHAGVCERLQRLNLIVPGIVVPDRGLNTPYQGGQ